MMPGRTLRTYLTAGLLACAGTSASPACAQEPWSGTWEKEISIHRGEHELLRSRINNIMVERSIIDINQPTQDSTYPLARENFIWDFARTTRKGQQSILHLSSDLLFEPSAVGVTLRPAAREKLLTLIAAIPRNTTVTISGHTDDRARAALNQPLSRKHAKAVARVLRAARPDLKLTVTGHGSSKPVTDNQIDGRPNPPGQTQNRRVEIHYITSAAPVRQAPVEPQARAPEPDPQNSQAPRLPGWYGSN
jgi:outer membrane protein OmpA-like peptidoglycan-associated protein